MHSSFLMPLFAMVFSVHSLPISNNPGEVRLLRKRAFSYIANETVCMVDNQVYRDGDPIPTDDPCEYCKCRPPGFACVLRECEVKPGCKMVRKEGECCPLYQCGCEHKGRFYNDGDRITNAESPCYNCYCQGSSITCALADCRFRFDCEPDYRLGECCPRYDHCPPLNATITTEATTETFSETSSTPLTKLVSNSNVSIVSDNAVAEALAISNESLTSTTASILNFSTSSSISHLLNSTNSLLVSSIKDKNTETTSPSILLTANSDAETSVITNTPEYSTSTSFEEPTNFKSTESDVIINTTPNTLENISTHKIKLETDNITPSSAKPEILTLSNNEISTEISKFTTQIPEITTQISEVTNEISKTTLKVSTEFLKKNVTSAPDNMEEIPKESEATIYDTPTMSSIETTKEVDKKISYPSTISPIEDNSTIGVIEAEKESITSLPLKFTNEPSSNLSIFDETLGIAIKKSHNLKNTSLNEITTTETTIETTSITSKKNPTIIEVNTIPEITSNYMTESNSMTTETLINSESSATKLLKFETVSNSEVNNTNKLTTFALSGLATTKIPSNFQEQSLKITTILPIINEKRLLSPENLIETTTNIIEKNDFETSKPEFIENDSNNEASKVDIQENKTTELPSVGQNEKQTTTISSSNSIEDISPTSMEIGEAETTSLASTAYPISTTLNSEISKLNSTNPSVTSNPVFTTNGETGEPEITSPSATTNSISAVTNEIGESDTTSSSTTAYPISTTSGEIREPETTSVSSISTTTEEILTTTLESKSTSEKSNEIVTTVASNISESNENSSDNTADASNETNESTYSSESYSYSGSNENSSYSSESYSYSGSNENSSYSSESLSRASSEEINSSETVESLAKQNLKIFDENKLEVEYYPTTSSWMPSSQLEPEHKEASDDLREPIQAFSTQPPEINKTFNYEDSIWQ